MSNSQICDYLLTSTSVVQGSATTQQQQPMAFKQLKKIDKRTQYSVFGWIRNKEKALGLRHVSSMIAAICILYFRDDEIFDVINEDMKLAPNKKLITKFQNDDDFKNNSYGINEISSMSDMIYEWVLKIHNLNATDSITFGIATKQIPSKEFDEDEAELYYAFDGEGESTNHSSNTWKSYGNTWSKNDIITMSLDLAKAQISLSINGQNQGVAYENVVKSVDAKYRLFASLVDIGDCVEILNFSRK